IVDLHHIVCDGASQSILFSDFTKYYDDLTPDPLPVTYKDYAEWETGFRLSEEYLSHREFWLDSLSDGIPEPAFVSSHLPAGKVSDAGGSFRFSADSVVLTPLLDYLKKENITNFSFFFSIYTLFLYQLTGKQHLLVGIVSSGRMQEEVIN